MSAVSVSTWAIRTNMSRSSRLPGSPAVCWASPLSCHSCSHLTNLPAPNGLQWNKILQDLKWHGWGTGVLGRVIYTWHLLTKCAHWSVNNAHSLTFSGPLFLREKGRIYQNFLQHHSSVIVCCFSGYTVIMKRPFRLFHFQPDSHSLTQCSPSALLCPERVCKWQICIDCLHKGHSQV